MKILLLGGTGPMGKNLVQLLKQDGIKTYVTSRKFRKNKKNVKYIKGNAQEDEFLEQILLDEWDVIIDFMVYKTDKFKKRIDLLLNSTSQYIFLSSARVYANSEIEISETSLRLLDDSKDRNFLSTDEYSLSKARQENILFKSGNNNWTIIRPYITYGDHRLQLGVLEKEEWLYRALKGRTIVFSKDILTKTTTMTYGLDVAKGIKSLIGKKDALENVFHITSDESFTWSKILSIYLSLIEDKLGYRPKVICQNMGDFIETHPAKYQIEYDRLFDRRFNNKKINRFTNTKNFYSIENGLERSISDFLRNPTFKKINWKLEARRDKQTAERTPLSEIGGAVDKIKYLIYRYL